MTTELDAATIAAIRERAPNVKNGTFTLSHETFGHFTVKLFTAQKGNLAGKRLLALLTGPDNERDWTSIAFWDDEKRQVFVWRKHRSPRGTFPIDGYHFHREDGVWSPFEKKLAIWADMAIRGATPERHGVWWQEGYRMQLAARCCRCNRQLTHPESIDAGIGPECAKRD